MLPQTSQELNALEALWSAPPGTGDSPPPPFPDLQAAGHDVSPPAGAAGRGSAPHAAGGGAAWHDAPTAVPAADSTAPRLRCLDSTHPPTCTRRVHQAGAGGAVLRPRAHVQKMGSMCTAHDALALLVTPESHSLPSAPRRSCTPPPERADEANWWLVGESGAKNGEKRLRRSVLDHGARGRSVPCIARARRRSASMSLSGATNG